MSTKAKPSGNPIHRQPRPGKGWITTGENTQYTLDQYRKHIEVSPRSLHLGNMNNRASTYYAAYSSTLRDYAIDTAPAFIDAMRQLQAKYLRRGEYTPPWEVAFIEETIKAMEAWQKAAIEYAAGDGNLTPVGPARIPEFETEMA